MCLVLSLTLFFLDLAFFYGEDRVASLTDPETMTPAVKGYVEAMKDACKINPALLVAHSYSRYLGDLSGKCSKRCFVFIHLIDFHAYRWSDSC
jgi:heme oxygenase